MKNDGKEESGASKEKIPAREETGDQDKKTVTGRPGNRSEWLD